MSEPTPDTLQERDFSFVLIETVTDHGSIYQVHIAMLNPDATLDHVLPEPFVVRATSVDDLRDALHDILALFDDIDADNGQVLKLKQVGDSVQLVEAEPTPALPA